MEVEIGETTNYFALMFQSSTQIAEKVSNKDASICMYVKTHLK